MCQPLILITMSVLLHFYRKLTMFSAGHSCLFIIRGMILCPCSCKQKKETKSTSTTDRYISFDGIDCDGNARILMSYIRRHIDTPRENQQVLGIFQAKSGRW